MALPNTTLQFIATTDQVLGTTDPATPNGAVNRELNKLLQNTLAIADQGSLPNTTGVKNGRGNTVAHSTFTGLAGEITVDTTKKTAVIHDGVTAGGFPLARQTVYNIKELGAVGNGSTDDTAIIQAAVNLGNNIAIEFPSGTYKTTSPIVFPTTAHHVTLFSRHGATISAAHTGDGLVLTTANENYGRHVVQGISVVGPNTWSPASYTSTGTGIKMHSGGTNDAAGYANTFRDVQVYGFKYGFNLQAVIACTWEGKIDIRYNEYGIYFDGGQTNINTFLGITVEYNKIAGIYSSGTYTASDATQNVFIGGLIQSNKPVSGGSGGATDSMGIYLKRAYDWNFRGIYIEDQDYGVYLGDGSSSNLFDTIRFASGAAGLAKIGIKGNALKNYGNVFSRCTYIPANATDVHVEVATGCNFNEFVDCWGINFIAGSILAALHISNNRPYADGTIKNARGNIAMPPSGFIENVSNGTARGQIDGIGTASAAVNILGVGEIHLGNGITGVTTIDEFTNMRAGQFFTVINLQATHAVTIKDSGAGGQIRLMNGDIQMTAAGEQVFFYVNAYNNVYEIGRNFVPANQVSGSGKFVRNSAPSITGLVCPGTIGVEMTGGGGASAAALIRSIGSDAASNPLGWLLGINAFATDGSLDLAETGGGKGIKVAPVTGAIRLNAYGAGTLTTDAAGNVTAVSDERAKDIQGKFTRGLADLLGIEPIKFKYKKESGLDQIDEYIGLSAQNILEHLPEAVSISPDGFYSVQDRTILAALVNSVKELNSRLAALGSVGPTVDKASKAVEMEKRKTKLASVAQTIKDELAKSVAKVKASLK